MVVDKTGHDLTGHDDLIGGGGATTTITTARAAAAAASVRYRRFCTQSRGGDESPA